MESRMEKYYRDDLSTFERTKRNQKLYNDISGQIDGLENLPIDDNVNEIDVSNLKNIISSRDEYHKAKAMGRTFVSDRPLVEEKKKIRDENRVYDINVLLENAKNEINKNAEVTNGKKINTNFLTNLEDANIPYHDDAMEIASQEVKEEKQKSDTDSLPLDILADLKGNDNTVVTDPIVKDEVTMIKKIKDGETFYSGSFNFTKKDFDEAEEDDAFFEKSNHTGVKVFFLIFGLLVLAAAIYLIITRYVL